MCFVRVVVYLVVVAASGKVSFSAADVTDQRASRREVTTGEWLLSIRADDMRCYETGIKSLQQVYDLKLELGPCP